MHIPNASRRSVSTAKALTAIDEGIINPMALVTSVDEQTIDVDINNGREPPAIKRQRTKT
ncbi:MAG: hypothetical protein ACYDEY_04615 [Acidimicrobiales bacterium]